MRTEREQGIENARILGDWLAEHYPTSEPDIAVAALDTLKQLHAVQRIAGDAEVARQLPERETIARALWPRRLSGGVAWDKAKRSDNPNLINIVEGTYADATAVLAALSTQLTTEEIEVRYHECNPGCSDGCPDNGKKYQRAVGPWVSVPVRDPGAVPLTGTRGARILPTGNKGRGGVRRPMNRTEAEVERLTAQLQAAQATIAAALSITVDGRGVVSALGQIRDRLSRADTSAHDAAILAARVKELRDAAQVWEGTPFEPWLLTHAASIEQTEANRG